MVRNPKGWISDHLTDSNAIPAWEYGLTTHTMLAMQPIPEQHAGINFANGSLKMVREATVQM